MLTSNYIFEFPQSLHLVYDLKVVNTKNHFKNNLSKLVQCRIEIKYTGETSYDNSNKSVYEIYKDKCLSESQREYIIECGIVSENL